MWKWHRCLAAALILCLLLGSVLGMAFTDRVEPENPLSRRQYVLCEYGGPGCPDIGIKPIWYTYIDDRWRISAECPLTQTFTMDCVKDIYDIRKDPSERKNLLKFQQNNSEVKKCCDIIRSRHEELQGKFSGEKFLNMQLNLLESSEQ